MKFTVPNIMAAPVANLIRLYDSLHVTGVCGIFTETTQLVRGMTIGALGLLSYCNELEVAKEPTEDLIIIDMLLPSGPISYNTLAEASGGYLGVPKHLQDNPVLMTTEEVPFKLLIGKTTPDEPLTQEKLSNYIIAQQDEALEFTQVPLPLYSKKVINFEFDENEEKTTVTAKGVKDNILQDFLKSL